MAEAPDNGRRRDNGDDGPFDALARHPRVVSGLRIATPAGVLALIPVLVSIAGSLSASCEGVQRIAALEATGIEFRLAVDTTLEPPSRAFLQRQIRELRRVDC